MNYKELSKFEKLALIQDINFSKCERNNVAKYLKALWIGDIKVINEYESYGDYPYVFLQNKRTYEQNLLFGFDEKVFDKYRWLAYPKFLDCEEISFLTKDQSFSSNYIKIGRGKNNVWTYGVSYSTGGGGGGYGISVWGEKCTSRKEAIICGLNELMNRHLRAEIKLKDDSTNFNKHLSNNIVKQVKERLREEQGQKAVQLSLF